MKVLRALLPLLAFLAGGSAGAGERIVTEVIYSARAAELQSVLAPLAAPEGDVGVFHDQLVIRATPEKLAEIRAVLQKLDRPLKNLRVSVRRREDASASRAVVTGQGRVTVRDGRVSGQADIRAGDDSAIRQGEQRYSVATVEGETVFIATGTEIPVPVVSSTPRGEIIAGPVYVPAQSGFEVRPRLQPGGSVLLEITAQHADPVPGGIRRETTRTQVQARLGEWTTLSGVERRESLQQKGLGGRVEMQRRSSAPLEILVEELP